MAVRKPSPELKAFGAEVTRLREAANLTRTDLAKKVNVSRSYVGQVEAGTTRCRRDFADRLEGALGCGSALTDAWDDLLRSTGYPRYFTDFTKAESSAVMLRSYETRLVYGLMQTPDYASVLLRSDTPAVQARMKRQEILRQDNPPMVCVVMDETVLYRQVGAPAVMKEQLEHLITLSDLDRLTLQIAPIAYCRGARASFTIATLPDRSEAVYLENAARGETSTDPGELTRVAEAFARLQSSAATEEASREMIRRVVHERWT